MRRTLVELCLKSEIATKKPLLRVQDTKRDESGIKNMLVRLNLICKKCYGITNLHSYFSEAKLDVTSVVGWRGLYSQCVDRTTKHGGGKINARGCFAAKGVGSFSRVIRIVENELYKSVF